MANMERSKRDKNSLPAVQKRKRIKPSRKSAKSKKPKRLLSDHFFIDDFACKTTGCNRKNRVKVSLGLIGALELLWHKAKCPLTIVKGYECDLHKTQSVYKNYHTAGLAAQITADSLTPEALFLLAEAIPNFQGLGLDLDAQVLYVDTRKDNPEKFMVKNGKRTEMTSKVRKKWLTISPEN